MEENRKLHNQFNPTVKQKPKLNPFKIHWNHDKAETTKPDDETSDEKQDEKIPPNASNRQSLLNCSTHGGPYDYESVEEMVYWKDIPQDLLYKSRFASNETRYLTFDTDLSGFNNQRMVWEINLVTAIVTGRTMVLPRGRYVSHLEQHGTLALHEFFNLQEMPNFQVMGVDEFIRKEGTIDKLHIPTNFTDFYERNNHRIKRELLKNGTTVYHVDTNNTDYHDHYLLDRFREIVCQVTKIGKKPCSNFTKWIERRHAVYSKENDSWFYVYFLDEFFSKHPKVYSPPWGTNRCVLTIPSNNSADPERMHDWIDFGFKKSNSWMQRRLPFVGHPAEVNAPPTLRLAQMYQDREGLCVYSEDVQTQKYFHMQDRVEVKSRLIGHWYDYMFFEDWREDLWAKRFVRDKIRYPDSLQCASARVVAQLRKLALQHNSDGKFHTMHIRRTDLTKAYSEWGVDKDASEIYYEFAVKRKIIPRDSVVYIATDEKEKSWFDVFLKQYKAVYFLDDFIDLIPEVPVRHYGMIDQLVCTKGENFVGTFYSTFTGYINRLRGYHSQKQNSTPAIIQQGRIPSWFYGPPEHIEDYQRFEPIGTSFFALEYALAWRNIDYDVDPILRKTVDQSLNNYTTKTITRTKTVIKMKNTTAA